MHIVPYSYADAQIVRIFFIFKYSLCLQYGSLFLDRRSIGSNPTISFRLSCSKVEAWGTLSTPRRRESKALYVQRLEAEKCASFREMFPLLMAHKSGRLCYDLYYYFFLYLLQYSNNAHIVRRKTKYTKQNKNLNFCLGYKI